IDLVLLDLGIPGIDGLEATRRLKASPTWVDIPVIMITGNVEHETLRTAFESGVVDYITKPLNRTELLVRVRSALRLKREMDGRRARERQLLEVMHQLEKANRQLELLSSQDPLTGIANRRQFDAVLEAEWRRASRRRAPLALVFVDVDCFKAYNDSHGHLNGDDCLTRIAATLSGQLRRGGDLAARYGGEEFAIVLSDTDLPGAIQVAEAIRIGVESLAITHSSSHISDRVTVSLGVAALTPDLHDSPRDLVADADAALYGAKRAGRNRTCPFTIPIDCRSLAAPVSLSA
ncbi:MAG: diguanylate cyclase, partial [Chloroflexi bacterium]|nr:diguanylate cyclase [Chloroflexota bacterium]